MYFHGIKLVIVALLINAVNGATDCTKSPSPENVKNCCKVPEPKYAAFKNQCGSTNIPSPKNPNTCYVECVFNTSKAFEGENLNMDNLRTMLTTLLHGKQEFVDSFAIGFEKCNTLIKERVENYKANHNGAMPKELNTANCPLWGSIHFICAYIKVFVACPESSWTSNKSCEETKEYVTTCISPIGGLGGRHGSSGRRRRDTMETEVISSNQVLEATDGQTQEISGQLENVDQFQENSQDVSPNGQRKHLNQENIQLTVQDQQRRKRDLSHQQIFDLFENWVN